MPTGIKTKSATPALSRRITKLTAELKTARKNLRVAVNKAVKEANVWKKKLAIQNSRWDAKLKKVEKIAFQKCAKFCAKKEIAKKKALHKAWMMAEAKFEKAYAKKGPKKKVKAKKVTAKKAVEKAIVTKKPARKVKK